MKRHWRLFTLVCLDISWLPHSIVGGEELVAHGLGISLSSHPVTEEEGGEEGDEGGVDGADTVGPHVESPADDPEFRESNSFDLL